MLYEVLTFITLHIHDTLKQYCNKYTKHSVCCKQNKCCTLCPVQPENILLATVDELTTVKLTDFGLSKLAADASQMTTFCGTFIYIAPELLEPATYTSQVDLWSLGVVLYVR